MANRAHTYQAYRKNLRRKAVAAYGGKCVCCGESHPAFLTIDHINGGGTKHRAEIGKGNATYKLLRRQGYPEGYQILCWNCNCGKSANGGVCPHKEVST